MDAALIDALQTRFADNLRWRLLFTEDGHLIQSKAERVLPRSGGPFVHPLAQFYENHMLFQHRRDEIFIPEDSVVPALNDLGILEVFEQVGQRDRFPCFVRAGARREYHLNPAQVKVGILTAGGTAPGLNVIIDSITKRHYQLGTEYAKAHNLALDLKVLGIRGGYVGLRDLDTVELGFHTTDTHALEAGSFLKALRGDRTEDMLDQLKERIVDLELDILYTVGGNGTQTAAHGIAQRLQAIEPRPLIVAGSKTMDNDLNFTDVTFGFRTTVDNAHEVIRRLHADAQTLNRLAIIELFGAKSGFVALHAAYTSGEVDYVLIPEMMNDPQVEFKRCVKRLAHRLDKNQHAVLVIAEGASQMLADGKSSDAFPKLVAAVEKGVKSAADQICQQDRPEAKKHAGQPVLPIGYGILTNEPRHQIRSTPPNTFDIDLCKYTGKLMVDAALAGYTDCAVNLCQNEYMLVPLATATARLKIVNIASYYFLSMMEKYSLD